MASQSIDSYTVDLGLNATSFQKGIKQATDSLSSFSSGLKGIAAGFAGGKFFQSITTGFMNTYTHLNNITSIMGYNKTEVHALGKVLEHVGGNVEGVVSTLNNLSSALEAAKWGSGSLIEVSKKYGISFQHSNGQLMTSEELLKSLHVQMQKYDKATRYAIASQLGLDEALQRAFLLSPAALQKQVDAKKALNKVTDEDTDMASRLEDPWVTLRQSWEGLSKELSHVVIPAFSKFLVLTTDFLAMLRDSKLLIPSFYLGVSVMFLKSFAFLKGIFSFNKKILKTNQDVNVAMAAGVGILGKFIPTLKGIGTAIKAIGFATIFNPVVFKILLIGALIAGIVLIIQDIYSYFQGWDSVTGDLLAKFPAIGSFFNSFKIMCKDIYDYIAGWITPLGEFFDKINIIKRITSKREDDPRDYMTSDQLMEEFGTDEPTDEQIANYYKTPMQLSKATDFHSNYNGVTPSNAPSDVTITNNITVNTNSDKPDLIGNAVVNALSQETKKYRNSTF